MVEVEQKDRPSPNLRENEEENELNAQQNRIWENIEAEQKSKKILQENDQRIVSI